MSQMGHPEMKAPQINGLCELFKGILPYSDLPVALLSVDVPESATSMHVIFPGIDYSRTEMSGQNAPQIPKGKLLPILLSCLCCKPCVICLFLWVCGSGILNGFRELRPWELPEKEIYAGVGPPVKRDLPMVIY